MSRRFSGIGVRGWAVTLAVVVAGVVAGSIGARDHALAQTPAVSASSGAEKPATSYAKTLSKAFREAAQKALPAVVMIKNVPAVHQQAAEQDEGAENAPDDPFGGFPPELRHFFKQFPQAPHQGMPRGEVSSLGSGVIIDPSGVILTNNHVVEGGGKLKVRLHDGREFDATEVKTDPDADLAIVRIKGAGALPVVKLANSDDLQVGDWVLALGDPFGLEGTVTAGIISAMARPLDNTRASFIQTDAAINPGNSGGPLVNLDGDVVGINRAIASHTGGSEGVGFAIPSNLAKWVSEQLIATGTVKRAYLGMRLQPVEGDLANKFGVQTDRGALVAQVMEGSPAATAGVKPGDVIVEFAGKAVANLPELLQAVDRTPIGQQRELVVVRGGQRTTLEVTARERPANYGVAKNEQAMPGKEGSLRDPKLGIEVSSLSAAVAEKLGVKAHEGVVITDVRNGSPADMAGLGSGMIIAEVNRQPVKSAEEFRAAMEKQSLETGVLLLIRSGQGTRFVVIRSS